MGDESEDAQSDDDGEPGHAPINLGEASIIPWNNTRTTAVAWVMSNDTDQRMPIIYPARPNERLVWNDCPRSVPWSVVAGHESQAWSNHGQTLERLAERGGLSPSELFAVVHDRRWQRAPMPIVAMVEWLRSLDGRTEGSTR